MWDFAQNQILGMKWLNVLTGNLISMLGLDTETRIGGRSEAKRILVPINHCDNVVVGVKNLNISSLIADVIDKVREVCF